MVVDDTLLSGAHRAIERYGWQRATLERIAAESGVSRMTLHRRGITREGLLAALADRLETAYRSAMWPALTARGSGRERLELALAGYCGAVEANLEVLAALAEADHSAIFHDEGPRGLSRPSFTEPIRRLLEDGAADGSLVVADPDEAATLLLNLVGWTYRHLRRGHGWSPDRAREGVLQIALDGVAARPPTALAQGAEPPGGGTPPPSTPSQGSKPPGGGTPPPSTPSQGSKPPGGGTPWAWA